MSVNKTKKENSIYRKTDEDRKTNQTGQDENQETNQTQPDENQETNQTQPDENQETNQTQPDDSNSSEGEEPVQTTGPLASSLFKFNGYNTLLLFILSYFFYTITLLLEWPPYYLVQKFDEIEKKGTEYPIEDFSIFKESKSFYTNKTIERALEDALRAFNKFKDSNDINERLRLMKRKSLLLTGRPGIGKTHLVKYLIGKNFNESFKVLVLRPDILNSSLVGGSNEQINNIFDTIRADPKSYYVIFFDEADLAVRYLSIDPNQCKELINYRMNFFAERGEMSTDEKEKALYSDQKYKDLLKPRNYCSIPHKNMQNNHFYNLLNGNDSTGNLNFICIYITNIERYEICERTARRFTCVHADITDENIFEIVKNALKDLKMSKEIKVDDNKNEIIQSLKELNVQRIIEVVEEFAEKKVKDNDDLKESFLAFLKRRGDEERKRMTKKMF